MAGGTPDWLNELHRRRTSALDDVDRFINGAKGTRLTAQALSGNRGGAFVVGWRVCATCPDGQRREFHVLGERGFPYTAPRIAVAAHPGVLAWPHVERDGLMCLLSPDAAVSSEKTVEVVEDLLNRACDLAAESDGRRNVDDFRSEFLSYWTIASDGAVRFDSILDPSGPSRLVKVWSGGGMWAFGEDADLLTRWLKRRGAVTRHGGDFAFEDAVLMWLPSPLTPTEYPSDASDLRELARDRSRDAVSILEDLATSRTSAVHVVIGAPSANGVCFGGVSLPRSDNVSGRRDKRQLEAGFRPGRVPKKLMVDRRLAKGVKVTKSIVQRADHGWIHGRDGDLRQDGLRTSRVAVLGCGSLGSGVARLLAQAGVGNLFLVDPGDLDWPNVSRHILGATSVNKNKATELARRIQEAYPHLGDIKCLAKRVGPDAEALVHEIASFDLIVSTMGNWAAEGFLSDVQLRSADFPPILFGWLERHAVAAHAVFVARGSGCLRCGVNDTGDPLLSVAEWPIGAEDRQEPFCGALYTPYGPTELCWSHALVAERALDVLTGEANPAAHRVWIGRRRHLEAANGVWSRKWIEHVGNPGDGGLIVEREWSSTECSFCAGPGPHIGDTQSSSRG